jgi:cyclin T
MSAAPGTELSTADARALQSDDEHWLFTADEVANTPSRAAGVPADTEARVLARTARFLHECARELLVPQLTIAVAVKFFQRFYMLESMTAHQPSKVAAACLFLACKVQETHKRLKDIIYWTVRVRTRHTADFPDGQEVLEDSPGYYDEKSSILDKEREVLRVLNFDLTCDHPYKHLWALNKLFIPSHDSVKKRVVTQSAWNFINDSFRCYVHVRYDPREIATAALLLAATLHRFDLPDASTVCPQSNNCFTTLLAFFRVDQANIDSICKQILDLYDDGRGVIARAAAAECADAANGVIVQGDVDGGVDLDTSDAHVHESEEDEAATIS